MSELIWHASSTELDLDPVGRCYWNGRPTMAVRSGYTSSECVSVGFSPWPTTTRRDRSAMLPNTPLYRSRRHLRRRGAPAGRAIGVWAGGPEPATLRAALAGRARSRPAPPADVPGRCATAADAMNRRTGIRYGTGLQSRGRMLRGGLGGARMLVWSAVGGLCGSPWVSSGWPSAQ